MWDEEEHDEWDGDEVEAEVEQPDPKQLWLSESALDEDDAP